MYKGLLVGATADRWRPRRKPGGDPGGDPGESPGGVCARFLLCRVIAARNTHFPHVCA